MWIHIRACSEKHTLDQIARWSLLGILSWYPLILVKSLQLLWWSEKCGWHLRVPDPRLSTRILRCDTDLSIINIPWQRNVFLPHLNKRWVKVHSDAFTMNYFFFRTYSFIFLSGRCRISRHVCDNLWQIAPHIYEFNKQMHDRAIHDKAVSDGLEIISTVNYYDYYLGYIFGKENGPRLN